MIVFFKAVGFCFLAFSGFGIGVYKSSDLKKKRDNMLDFCLGLKSLAEEIRISAEEIFPLVKRAFSEYSLFDITTEKIRVKSGAFLRKDEEKANEFLMQLGTSDKKGECEKISAYGDLFYERYQELNKEYGQKSKVYKTVGFCVGVTLGLFII
ncbi:MAG: stage III sporulation protein AB [Clostridia bacterium]|nr:stage III sporulation protein AB [Clostridia bacterium]